MNVHPIGWVGNERKVERVKIPFHTYQFEKKKFKIPSSSTHMLKMISNLSAGQRKALLQPSKNKWKPFRSSLEMSFTHASTIAHSAMVPPCIAAADALWKRREKKRKKNERGDPSKRKASLDDVDMIALGWEALAAHRTGTKMDYTLSIVAPSTAYATAVAALGQSSLGIYKDVSLPTQYVQKP